jgi:pseudaminic acid cytidylyltransferase
MSEKIKSIHRVAFIPARGGSKRIPRKNIREFEGKPMIAWSIGAALASGLFGRVLVSTDDEEIASVARAYGAEVPTLRPAGLADDHTGLRAVMRHCVSQMIGAGEREPDQVCFLLATAPFIRGSDLCEGLNRLEASGASFAYSVARYAYPIQRAIRIRDDGRVEMVQPAYRQTRSQDMEEAYHDAGQFYWGKGGAFLDETMMIASPESVAVVLPFNQVVDIDTEEDWRRAEMLFRLMKEEELWN